MYEKIIELLKERKELQEKKDQLYLWLHNNANRSLHFTFGFILFETWIWVLGYFLNNSKIKDFEEWLAWKFLVLGFAITIHWIVTLFRHNNYQKQITLYSRKIAQLDQQIIEELSKQKTNL